MNTISISLTEKQISDLEYKYRSYTKRLDVQHTRFQVKGPDVTITVYKSGKAVFAGEGAEFHASFYTDIIPNERPSKQEATDKVALIPNQEMAGSDEVGTGDYFGPVVVCAAIIRKEDYAKLPLDIIRDTKQLSDDVIRTIAPSIMATLKYSLLILSNKKYNEIHKTNNMNVIKTKLHNQAYVNLSKKYPMPKLCVIDQFLAAPSYYKHLKNEPQVFRQLQFETKAENKFLAVACAAIIARYAFLDVFDQMEENYKMVFPKGAGSKVDDFGKRFVQEYGNDALEDVAKVHFINTQRIISN